MNSQDQNQPTEAPVVNNPLAVMEPGERIICEIKRHPIGMLGIYAMAGFVLLIIAILAFVVAPAVLTNTDKTAVMRYGGIVFLVAALLAAGFTFVSHIVYWGNRWILTSDSITQVTQNSLFDKRSSQLSLAHLEDITAEQNGILTHMFNYGVIRAETAGERSKFTFLFCPMPNAYAQQILRAREEFEQVHHGGKQQPTYVPQSTQAASYQAAPAPASPEHTDPTTQQPTEQQ